MMMLPPIAPTISGERPERRARARRVADRTQQTDAAVEQPDAAPGLQAEPRARFRGRARGRRASDREPETASAAPFGCAPKPHAPLVAQLVATALGLEQTRSRRRGSIEEAVALYGRRREKPKRPRGEA
ncbi:hypothetical protein [Hansschlegelia zhihuaiae]|nr:hypothetical protein [Hansschlegelia zhihuaiae]